MTRPIRAFMGYISPQQEVACLCLAKGSSMTEAKEQAKVGSITTLQRWLREPKIRKRIKELREEITEQAVGKLADGMISAALTLIELCLDGENQSIRLKAADAILSHGKDLLSISSIQERLEDLEQSKSPVNGRGQRIPVLNN